MKLIRYNIIILAILLSAGSVLRGQCVAEISTDPANGSQNLTVQFYGNGSTASANYDCDNSPLPGGWASTPFTIGSPCQVPDAFPAPDATDYLWVAERNVSGERFIETPSLDLTDGGTISFEIRYGVHPLAFPLSDCKGPNAPDEGVALEYSISGGPWMPITYYMPQSPDTTFTDWNLFEYTVPVIARTSDTRIRWYQEKSSNDATDRWGLNNISIDADISVDSYSWDFGDGSPLDSNQNPIHTFPDFGQYDVSLSISTSEPCSDTKDTIIYINSTPTIDNIIEIDVNSTDESADIPLSGITDGGIGGQTLILTAVSSNPSSLSIDEVSYISPQTTALITVSPDSTMCGDATITASVEYTNLKTISYDELFAVHVIDKTLPVLTTCPDDIVAEILPGKCDTIITFTAPTGTDNCPAYTLVQTSGLSSGSVFTTGTTYNEFTITDASGNEAKCGFTVTISENIPPTISCPADILAAECNNTLTIPSPVAADNCGIESIRHNSPYAAENDNASGTYPVGITIVKWTVTDLSGNTASCDQRIEVTPNPVQPSAPDINVKYGETALLSATPDADHYIRWYENSDLSDIPTESSTLDLGFLTPGTYYRYASQVSTITGCEGLALPVAAIVDKAVLTVSTQDAFISYGDAIPFIPIDLAGFVFGEDRSVINEEPLATVNADENSDAGTYPIIFSAGYDNNYSFVFETSTLTIEKIDQVITFEDPPDNLRVTEEYNLVATAESGLPVIFTLSGPDIAEINGDLITITKEGTTTIYANNDGGNNYNDAPEVTQQIYTLPAFDNSTSLFTPNADGYNDYWHIPFIDLLGTTAVKVYNRQGKLVFESKAYANDWDGTYNGNPLPGGAYYFTIENAAGDITKGVVNIVR